MRIVCGRDITKYLSGVQETVRSGLGSLTVNETVEKKQEHGLVYSTEYCLLYPYRKINKLCFGTS